MQKQNSQSGFILPVTLFLLSCVLLWGSVLLQTLTSQYEADNGIVYTEQSRLLAYSGWNLALQQLDTDGSLEPLQIEKRSGFAEVTMEQREASNEIAVSSVSNAGGYLRTVEGSVRLLCLPWDNMAEWQLTGTLNDIEEPSVYCTGESQMILNQSVNVPLAIQNSFNQPVNVSVTEPVYCDVLYISGNLNVEAPLEAEAVYVSGQINGAEQIISDCIAENYTGTMDYRVQVIARSV